MAYQTGVANSQSDLIAALQAFAIANAGFTAGTSWTTTNGANKYYSSTIVKNGVNYGFAVTDPANSDKSYFWMNTFVGAPNTTVSANSSSQPNAAPRDLRIGNLAGPFVGHHFFTDGVAVHAAIEIVTGVFVHINFGEISKIGAWAGGQFITGGPDVNGNITLSDYFASWGSMPFNTNNYSDNNYADSGVAGHVRVPTLGPTATISRRYTSTVVINSAMAGGVGRVLLDWNPNMANGRAVLVPIHFHQTSNGGSGPWLHLGFVTNARFVNIKNLNPKDIVNTDWMVFPVSQKNGPASVYANSGNYGLAYKK
jgi:hypothetical protein